MSVYRAIAPGELDAGLKQAWQATQSASEAFASPYFSPHFTCLMGEARRDVRVIVVEEGTRPAAFFACQRSVLGFGRPVGGSLSDYHGVVARRESAWRVPELLRAAKLFTWKFDHLVDPGGQFAPFVKGLATSPQIDLRAGYEAYAAGRRRAGSQVVDQAERKARKLGREHGEVLFTLHDRQPDAWGSLLRWKAAQYRASGMIDPFRFRWTRTLLERIRAEEGAEFAGVLSSLRVDGRVVALHLGMRSRAVLHWWFPAYDPAFARYSVGIVLLLRLARAVAGAGVRMIDLGRGDDPYKARVMTGSAPLAEGSVERSPWLGRLAHAREAALRTLRQVEQRWVHP